MKTKGAKDKTRRKGRSDKGKRRLKYAGKLTKPKRIRKGKYYYVSKRRGDEPLKLWFWSIEPMNPEHIKNFSRETRRQMRKVVYGKERFRVDVPTYYIENRENLEAFCLYLGLTNGNWLVMGFSHTMRNKFHVKPVKLFEINIRDTQEGFVCKMTRNHRLYRYKWWWKG